MYLQAIPKVPSKLLLHPWPFQNKYRFPLQIQKLARPLEEFGACSSTEVESKVCVSSAIPLGANYVGGCSRKSDFTIDLTEAFDFLGSQATGGVFQLSHELYCLMSGPERSLLRMTLQLIQLLIRSVWLQTVHVTLHNQLHDCLTLSWIPQGSTHRVQIA